MTSIIDYIKTDTPFEYAELTAEDYMPIDAVLDKPFVINDVEKFTNDKGDGVYILIDIDDKQKYICTHAVGLVKAFDNERLMDAIVEKGVPARIVKRKSMKSDRMVYAFA